MGDAFSVDDFLAEHQPSRASARICARRDLLDRHAQLAAELDTAIAGDLSENRDPVAPAIAEAIGELETEIAAATREFVFEGLPKTAWTALMAEHPPLDEHKAMHVDHNPETFPAVAVAASCVQPKMTVDQTRQLEAKVSTGQWIRLWTACLNANLGGDESPKSERATALRRLSGAFSTTAAREESLAASS